MKAALLFRIINAARAVDDTHFNINATTEMKARAWADLALARLQLEHALDDECPEIKVEQAA